MGAVRDFIDAFRPGRTKPGNWRQLERYGRFEGTGEVVADIELPAGRISVGAEDFFEVERFELELTGPDGQPVEIRRWSANDVKRSVGAVHHFVPIATGEVRFPGLHRLRVRAETAEQPLLILVGEGLAAGPMIRELARDIIPGRKLWRRLRGED